MKETRSPALKAAAVAEIQAIAIYQAECFWIRQPERARLLRETLEEEQAHGRFLEEWVEIGAFEVALNRVSGWILGSVLALLPWRLLCRVQSWAEGQAKEIYVRALARANLGRDPRLKQGLEEAIASEAGHAAKFYTESLRASGG